MANNVAAIAEARGMQPTAAGEITISLAPTAANTNSNHFTYLGVLRLRVREPASLLPPTRLGDSVIAIDWTGEGELEWTDDLLAPDWTRVLPTPLPPWFDDTKDQSRRFYRLRSP